MTAPVSLRDLVAELALASRKRSMALDLSAGTFVPIPRPERAPRRSLGPGPAPAEGATSSAIDERIARGELLPLPSERFVRLGETARRFAETRPDPDLREALLWALRGRGGLHCFQDTLRRLEHESAWEQERDRHLAELAVTWLERHQVSYIRDLAPWGQLRRVD